MASQSSTTTRLQPPSWLSESKPNTLREASFSSYLNTSEETYISSLIDSSHNHFVSNQKQQFDNLIHAPNSRPKKAENGEIDVFSADKYFSSGILDQEYNSINSTKSSRSDTGSTAKFHQHLKHGTEVVQRQVNPKFQSRTPSISQSERSLNSQSALLRRVHSTNSKAQQQQQQGSGMISFLSCYCCVKKSVDIDQDEFNNNGKGFTRSIKTNLNTAVITRINKLRVDHKDSFVFPDVMNKVELMDDVQEYQDQESRQSLDVFGSSELDDGSKRFSLAKRLNMLSWDAIPTTTEQINNTSGAPSETCKDTESDASSDLFEIECLSCTANPVIQGPGLLSDGCSTPTTGYAPSEASIDWSVVTASAADFSIASDSEDQRSSGLPLGTRLKLASKGSSAKIFTNKEVQKPVSSLLLGCKSQKAVNVAREVHRRSPTKGKSQSQRMQGVSDSFAPVTRFQAEAKLAGFSHRQKQNLSPDLLYIQ
ncbi:protein PHYTOCHROME KINASE SUBSTRATE 1 [Beta vulgaris subsp. vulgaris]|uniref:protein PHYTOCHROME KINASE SUBSTRATE 1 n=1 Tax=Beta vulgaris subsp. vulgaris TaxID=3555 RepID=UPI002036B141|nr:protein PHYTOCHROME KINASE SUBSTRATE 1 [Beta vulgaris subsp. vulgaris]